MPKQLFFIILVCILMLTTFSTIIPTAAETLPKYDTNNTPADFIYFNGNFVTMDEKNEDPKFVAVKNGIIIAVSRSVRDFSKLADSHTQWINLNGKTMIPGLVDGHSHFSETAYRVVQGFNISPPPFGNVTSIAQLLDALRTFITTKNIPPGQSINGSGYSDLDMVEKRHPTRYELDSVSAVNPIVLTHFSGHIVVANSLALEKVNYTSTASAPAGGILDTFPNGTLTGICREYALLPLQAAFTTNFAQLTPEQIQLTVNEYFKSGVTTVQDMLRSEAQAIKYHSLGDNFPLDINAYYWVTGTNLTTFQRIVASYNTTRFRTRGAKFILDGSIQAFTALLTQPYWVPQSQYSNNLTGYEYNTSRSCSTENCGSDSFPSPVGLRMLFQSLINSNVDVHAHCNGDGAADNMIAALEWARNNSNATNDARIVMIHAQTVREDQLDKFNRLGLIPSFFSDHIYYWGDKHYQIFLGPNRANRMNPAGSALKRGLKFTLHNDSPTVLAGLFNGVNTFLKLISAAVTRTTANGRVLDDGTQKIPVYQALKALTINSAWQSHEQDAKGSIEVGKVADLVILNKNPLTIANSELDSLSVVATIKGGNLVFGDYSTLNANN